MVIGLSTPSAFFLSSSRLRLFWGGCCRCFGFRWFWGWCRVVVVACALAAAEVFAARGAVVERG